jgi:probable F420-dependent oxidoreductase
MKIGVVYPQTEFGNDPVAIREYAQTVEGLGYDHILAYDHVLGVNPERSDEWEGPYTYQSPFQSPFILFSFMAGSTEKVGFTTGVLILPQRQTALVAKQAASLDVLSGGRLRLGVGLGWNKPEYIAVGENFHDRGLRIEEQVRLMRQLWTKPLVDFSGKWHTIPDAGLNPLPIQRPIPIWFGGHADAVLRRVAIMGDGWMPAYRNTQDALPSLEKINRYMDEAGRDRSSLGIEARIYYRDGNPDNWESSIRRWEEAGATHITFHTMNVGFQTPTQHIEALRKFASVLWLYNE